MQNFGPLIQIYWQNYYQSCNDIFIKYLNKLENNLISYKVLRTDFAVLDICFFHLKE